MKILWSALLHRATIKKIEERRRKETTGQKYNGPLLHRAAIINSSQPIDKILLQLITSTSSIQMYQIWCKTVYEGSVKIWEKIAKNIYLIVLGRPFVKGFALSVCVSVCVSLSWNVGVLWPNDWMDQCATLYGGRPRPSHLVLDGDAAAPRKGVQQPPLFGPCLLWPTGWMDQDSTWKEVGLGPGVIVLDGELRTQLSPPPQKGAQQPPLFGPCLLWPYGRPSSPNSPTPAGLHRRC